MGSDSLILDEILAAEIGVELDADTCGASRGWTRRATGTRGALRVSRARSGRPGAPHLGMRDPEVMVQRIIYDGLVGDAFLRNFLVTWDIAGSRLVLTPAEARLDP